MIKKLLYCCSILAVTFLCLFFVTEENVAQDNEGFNMKNLNDEQKLGQLLFIGIPVEKDLTRAKTLIQTFRPGGLLLYPQRGNTAQSVYEFTSALQKESYVPLFLAVDQEGGFLQNLNEKHGFTGVPSAMAIAATQNPKNAYTAGKILGSELRAAGINLDFAPVLDVNTKIENPIIHVRSFGKDTPLVSNFGMEMMKGLHDGGVLTCGKHFPGHGDTTVDSHKGLPMVSLHLKQLEDVHIKPFSDAVKNKLADFLMTAHVVYPALDKDNPATLSKKILTDYLRAKLRYEGIIITDALEMQALSGKKSFENLCMDSLLAGADMLLVADADEKKLFALKSFLLEQMQKNKELKNAVENSAARILKLKQSKELLPLTAFSKENFQSRESVSAAQTIAKESLTLIKNSQKRMLPVSMESKILLVSPKPVIQDPATGWTLTMPLTIGAYLKSHHPFIAEFLYSGKPSKKEMQKLQELAKDADVLVFVTFSLSFSKEQKEMADKLSAMSKPAIAVVLTTPYDVKFLKKFPAVLLTYGFRTPQLAAAAEALLHVFEYKGKLPVTLQ